MTLFSVFCIKKENRRQASKQSCLIPWLVPVAFWVKARAPSVSAGQQERLTLSSEHTDGMKQKQRESDTLNKHRDAPQSVNDHRQRLTGFLWPSRWAPADFMETQTPQFSSAAGRTSKHQRDFYNRRLVCFTVFMCWCRHFYWSAAQRASPVRPDGTNTRVRSARISPADARSHLEKTKHENRSETASVKMLMRLWASHTWIIIRHDHQVKQPVIRQQLWNHGKEPVHHLSAANPAGPGRLDPAAAHLCIKKRQKHVVVYFSGVRGFHVCSEHFILYQCHMTSPPLTAWRRTADWKQGRPLFHSAAAEDTGPARHDRTSETWRTWQRQTVKYDHLGGWLTGEGAGLPVTILNVGLIRSDFNIRCLNVLL